MSCKNLLHDKTSPPLQSVIRLKETDKNENENENENENKNEIGSKIKKNNRIEEKLNFSKMKKKK